MKLHKFCQVSIVTIFEEGIKVLANAEIVSIETMGTILAIPVRIWTEFATTEWDKYKYKINILKLCITQQNNIDTLNISNERYNNDWIRKIILKHRLKFTIFRKKSWTRRNNFNKHHWTYFSPNSTIPYQNSYSNITENMLIIIKWT